MSCSKIPKAPSPGEAAFSLHCKAEGLIPAHEYHFCEGRRWRFDFAFVGQKIAVEVEGGTWIGGRHTRGSSFAADCNKYNRAALLGWRVLRYPTEQIMDGTAINDVLEALSGR